METKLSVNIALFFWISSQTNSRRRITAEKLKILLDHSQSQNNF